MRFYLAGQTDFGNRGCEALVRSIIATLREQDPAAEFLIPSINPARDARQWPELDALGGQFVRATGVPFGVKWWNRAIRFAPALRSAWEPSCTLPRDILGDVTSCDAVIMTGGDIISLDYGPGSLFKWSTFMDAAKAKGVPTILYAASVGPFKDPVFERFMRAHLGRYTLITVRESATLAYLQRLGCSSAVAVADPAFRLEPQPIDLPAVFSGSRDGVLGFNVSPVVADSWRNHGNQGDLLEESAGFLRRVIEETGLSVALIPHVDPLDGSEFNSDSAYMDRLYKALSPHSSRVHMIERGRNAAQLKHVIGACRFFIGARTHATVAAWSQGVPTISIAYSVKARGLNQDLFGSLDYVLETPKVSVASLWASLQTLLSREADARALLAQRIPDFKRNAARSAEILAAHLRRR